MRTPDLSGARVLVAGAAGFIGANLVRALLTEGADVLALVRSPRVPRLAQVLDELEVLVADVRDPDAVARAVARARPELAVNLVVSFSHPKTPAERLEHLETSALGTAALVESLAASGCRRLVHIGSSLEYGQRDRPIDEDALLSPVVPRGAAKAAATLVCLTWARTLGISAVVLRPFSVFGPWEDARRIVPRALRAALEGADLPLTPPGLAHDFVYVGDVVGAILHALGAGEGVAGQVINVGSGVQTTNEELVAAVSRVVGRSIRTRVGSYPCARHDTGCWVASIERARTLLGWTPRTSLEEGLKHTLAWLTAEGIAR